MAARVEATERALRAVEALAATHGELMFFQSGGCCDGSSPICLPLGELPVGPNDVRLGDVAGAPVYIDGEQDRRWNRPRFVIDVAPGAPEGFSLGPSDAHFVSRSPAA